MGLGILPSRVFRSLLFMHQPVTSLEYETGLTLSWPAKGNRETPYNISMDHNTSKTLAFLQGTVTAG